MIARFVSARFISLLLFCGALSILGALGCAEEGGSPNAEDHIVLEITHPAPGAFINRSRVRVRGTATQVKQVSVNGQRAEVSSGEWDALVQFNEGPASVTVEAEGVERSVDFTVDTVAPKIELDSPERGLIMEEDGAGEVVFSGRVIDEGSGLKVLSLGGDAVEVDESGEFNHKTKLELGYNEFELKAVDQAGNPAKTLRAALYGPLAAADEEIDSAAEIQIAPALLDTASQVIVQLLSPAQISGFVQDALGEHENLTLDGIDFNEPQVEIRARSADQLHDEGYLSVEVKVKDLSISGVISFGGDDYPASIGLDELLVSTEILLAPSPGGGLDIALQDSELQLDDEDIHFDLAGATEQDLGSGLRDVVRSAARTVAQTAFSDLLGDQVFDQLYDPGVLRRKVELLGREMEFQLYVRQVRITDGGGVFLRASLAVTSPKYPDIPEVDGALNLALGGRETPSLKEDMMLTTQKTAINRILHGVWNSGLLNQELVGADFAGFELPVELSAAALSLLLDSRISDLATSQTPAGLKLRPLLPPVASLSAVQPEPARDDEDAEENEENEEQAGGGASDLHLRLGSVMTDLMLMPEGEEPIDIVTVALFLDVSVRFEARDGQLALSLDADVRADVDDKPTIDLDDNDVEGLLEDLAKLATQMIGDEMELGAEMELGWVKVDNPRAEVHGVDSDQLTVGAGILATP